MLSIKTASATGGSDIVMMKTSAKAAGKAVMLTTSDGLGSGLVKMEVDVRAT